MDIAFPRSPYHLKLLKENDFKGVCVITRSMNFVGLENSVVYVGEESPLRYLKNISIYRRLSRLVNKEEPGKVIIFDSEKPIHKYLIDLCIKRNVQVELWEDGLFYYMPVVPSKVIYFSKYLVKVICGYYPRGFMQLKYKEDKLNHRDRFKNKNLVWVDVCTENPRRHSGGLFVGQPLVQDNFCSLNIYIAGLAEARANYDIACYFPHPRESVKIIKKVKELGFVVISNLEGFESYTRSNVHDLYVSPFSTALLNVSADCKRVFCPGYFNLWGVRKLLNGLDFLKVKIL